MTYRLVIHFVIPVIRMPYVGVMSYPERANVYVREDIMVLLLTLVKEHAFVSDTKEKYS